VRSVRLSVTVDADIASFDAQLPRFVGRLAAALGVQPAQVAVTLSSGSVLVSARIMADDAAQATAAVASWQELVSTGGTPAAARARLSGSLGVRVVAYDPAPSVRDELVVLAPPPPSPPPQRPASYVPSPPADASTGVTDPQADGGNTTSLLTASPSLFGLELADEVLLLAAALLSCIGVGVAVHCCRRRTAKAPRGTAPSRAWPAERAEMATSTSTSLELQDMPALSGAAASASRGTPSAVVIEDARGRADAPPYGPAASPRIAQPTIVVRVTFRTRGALGIVLGEDMHGHAMIRAVHAESEAEAQGACAGSLIVSVNDVGVRDLPKDTVRDMIAYAPRPLTLQLEIADPDPQSGATMRL